MIKRELLIFLIVGLLTVLVDFLTYRGLIWLNLMNIDFAKGMGFLVGTVFAYFANRVWTFGQRGYSLTSMWRFVLLYATTLGVNVWVNTTALRAFEEASMKVQLAFLLATGISAALNFTGMKWFVFRSKSVELT